MKKIMKLNIAICDDNKLVLENEKALIEENVERDGNTVQDGQVSKSRKSY